MISPLSSLMERIARVRVKDCFKDNETIYFVVATGEMGKALNALINGLRKISLFSKEIGKENYSSKFEPLGSNDFWVFLH